MISFFEIKSCILGNSVVFDLIPLTGTICFYSGYRKALALYKIVMNQAAKPYHFNVCENKV